MAIEVLEGSAALESLANDLVVRGMRCSKLMQLHLSATVRVGGCGSGFSGSINVTVTLIRSLSSLHMLVKKRQSNKLLSTDSSGMVGLRLLRLSLSCTRIARSCGLEFSKLLNFYINNYSDRSFAATIRLRIICSILY